MLQVRHACVCHVAIRKYIRCHILFAKYRRMFESLLPFSSGQEESSPRKEASSVKHLFVAKRFTFPPTDLSQSLFRLSSIISKHLRACVK